ncbi:MAG: hypothetical protein ACI9FG_000470 [Crocinitomicaceae bacterium]|jgi:hypothetical protein
MGHLSEFFVEFFKWLPAAEATHSVNYEKFCNPV